MKFHCAALSVKGKPLHLEVAQPFHSVGYLKTDHVRRPVKKVSVVKESFLSVFVAEVGIGNHPPDLICVCLAVFVSVFDVLIHRPRLPKQTSVLWIYDVEFLIPLKVLKCDLLIALFDMPNLNRFDILSISIFCKIALSISIFSKITISISISIFLELPYRYRYRYRYFQK